jgi:hypothetical protein
MRTDRIDSGSVMRRTLGYYMRDMRVWLPGSAVVFGIAGIVSAILLALSPLLIYVSFLISDVALALFTAIAVNIVTDTERGQRNARAGEFMRDLRPVIGQVLIVGMITGIGIFVGFVLIVVPGLVLTTVWCVATPVVVMERRRGLSALRRSRELVRGNGWRVFGVLLVFVLCVGLLTSGVDLAAAAISTGAGVAARVVFEIVTAPLGAFASAVLYLDLTADSRSGQDRPEST